MKYQFIFTVDGKDLRAKLEKAIEENPKLHLEFIGSFSQGLIKALEITEEDNISIEGFKAVKIEDTQEQKPGIMEGMKNERKRGIIRKLLDWIE